MSAPIFLFTDFGSTDIYVGQVKAVLHAAAPASAVVDLLNDAPNFEVEASAHLLAALAVRLPVGSVTMAVVDPGVGTARGAVAVEADGRWFVGPDNGLISVVAARAAEVAVYALPRPDVAASVSFHGRDLFAPFAARIASGVAASKPGVPSELGVSFGAADLEQVIYIDHYGNVISGLRANIVDRRGDIRVNGTTVAPARVFGDVPRGQLFWYSNSLGLVEIASNQEHAAGILAAAIGDAVCPV